LQFQILNCRLRFVEKPTLTHKFSGEIARSKCEVTPAYGARNVSRRLLGASVCGRVVAGVQVSRDRLWSSCGHENRAGVSVFVWKAGKSVS
jgi:hypothetical protein